MQLVELGLVLGVKMVELGLELVDLVKLGLVLGVKLVAGSDVVRWGGRCEGEVRRWVACSFYHHPVADDDGDDNDFDEEDLGTTMRQPEEGGGGSQEGHVVRLQAPG